MLFPSFLNSLHQLSLFLINDTPPVFIPSPHLTPIFFYRTVIDIYSLPRLSSSIITVKRRALTKDLSNLILPFSSPSFHPSPRHASILSATVGAGRNPAHESPLLSFVANGSHAIPPLSASRRRLSLLPT